MKKTPLLHSKSGRERIVVAIYWDERNDKITVIDKLKRTHYQHDLDVSCFVYDSDGHYIDFVGPMAQDAMDGTGCIYHSGDDSTGAGTGDDEFISVELAGLPPQTQHLFFVTEIRTNHTFSQVLNPHMRLADGMSNKNLVEMPMGGAKGADKQACVMFSLSRDKTSPTGWGLQILDEYPNLAEVSDWGAYLTRYL
jgi:tellurium resistance protein TerZ